MRILNLISSLSGGGAELQLSYLAPELVKIGHQVHIAYITEGPNKPKFEGVLLYKLETRSNYNPCLLIQIFWLIRKIKPDIIHTWILQMDIIGGIVSRISNIPWTFREPNSIMQYPGTWKDRLRIAVNSGAKAVVSNSEGGDDYWRSKQPSICRYIVQNALPLDEIDHIDMALPSAIKLVELPIVLFVGRLEERQKRPKLFLEVLECILQKFRVLGILCGEGPAKSELDLFVSNRGLAKDVFFTGYLPSNLVWNLMKRASVLVSLSTWEGCPNTVMEAMACGCPLVISDIPAHREILNDNSALFIDQNDIQQTVDSIVYILSDAKAAKDRTIIAKKKAQAWSITEMAKKYEKIYIEQL